MSRLDLCAFASDADSVTDVLSAPSSSPCKNANLLRDPAAPFLDRAFQLRCRLLKANIQASAQLSRPRNGCFAPHHRLAKTQISCAILPRAAASFLFYKSHKSYKSYKSYFYQATGCTPGGKQASAQLSRPREVRFAHPADEA